MADGVPKRQETSGWLSRSLWGLALRWHRDLLQCPLVTLCLLSVTLHGAWTLMASSQSPDTTISATMGLHPHQPQHPSMDREAALRQLAAQAKISQVRVCFARFAQVNKFASFSSRPPNLLPTTPNRVFLANRLRLIRSGRWHAHFPVVLPLFTFWECVFTISQY
jgi:hypothetical protein